jgi:Flp pilus assembly protein TadG
MRPLLGRRGDDGSAVVDFVLVMVVLVPLFLGVLQVALVLHVRNTLTAAAVEGARLAATVDQPLAAGHRVADDVTASTVMIAGVPGVRVQVVADVPPLGLWGPAVRLELAGHAIAESAP